MTKHLLKRKRKGRMEGEEKRGIGGWRRRRKRRRELEGEEEGRWGGGVQPGVVVQLIVPAAQELRQEYFEGKAILDSVTNLSL